MKAIKDKEKNEALSQMKGNQRHDNQMQPEILDLVPEKVQ